MSFSPDDKLLASSSADGTIRVRDLKTQEELFVKQQYGVRNTAFTPDGTQLVSVGDDGTIRLWAVPVGGTGQ